VFKLHEIDASVRKIRSQRNKETKFNLIFYYTNGLCTSFSSFEYVFPSISKDQSYMTFLMCLYFLLKRWYIYLNSNCYRHLKLIFKYQSNNHALKIEFEYFKYMYNIFSLRKKKVSIIW
jgi:hypothetical protein